jgi:glyoxylase-like metal-dependent hydrolase (beta-lactamase superfamily II)
LNKQITGVLAVSFSMLMGCASAPPPPPTEPPPAHPAASPPAAAAVPEPPPAASVTDPPPPPPAPCGNGKAMSVHFYDAGQALAALVTLPDGRRVLVDAGESPKRAGCGAPCKAWHQRVMDGLKADIGTGPLELLWITHQHSDDMTAA